MAGSLGDFLITAQRIQAIANERRRQELSLHFFFLGGLRYTNQQILEIIGGGGMIPLEQLRRSSFYQFILNEGLQEGRQEGRQEGHQEGQIVEAANMVIKLMAKRFPLLDLKEQILQIDNVNTLEQLALDLLEIADADLMKQNVYKILSQNNLTSDC